MDRTRKLNLPEYEFRYRNSEQKIEIYDEFRKKFVVLTPEEWVRQNILKYLHIDKNIPLGLMAIEKGLTVNRLKKRTDILVFNNKGIASMIVECKAPDVILDQNVFEQIARYNMTLKVKYLLVTNGINHYCCKINFDNKSYVYLDNIPDYGILNE